MIVALETSIQTGSGVTVVTGIVGGAPRNGDHVQIVIGFKQHQT